MRVIGFINKHLCPYCEHPLIQQKVTLGTCDVGLPPAFKAMFRKGYVIMLQCLNCYQHSTHKTPKVNWFLVFPNESIWEFAKGNLTTAAYAYEWRKVKYKLKTAHIMY